MNHLKQLIRSIKKVKHVSLLIIVCAFLIYFRSYVVLGRSIIWFRVDLISFIISLPIECICYKGDIIYWSIGADKASLSVGKPGYLILDIYQGNNCLNFSSLDDGFYSYNMKIKHMYKNDLRGWIDETVWLRIDTCHSFPNNPAFNQMLKKIKKQ